MGFMDEATTLAEPAQQKLDEAQQQLSQGQAQQQGGFGMRYDEHRHAVQGPTAPAPAASALAGDGPDPTPDPFKPL